MFFPRPLVISMAVVAILLLVVSTTADLQTQALLEVVLIGFLLVVAVTWVSQHKSAGRHPADNESRKASDMLSTLGTELENMRRYHRQMLLDLPLGVCALDGGEGIVTWNRAMEQMTGLSGAGVTGKRVTELPAPWLALLNGIITSEYTHVFKQSLDTDGKKRTVNLHKSVIGDPSHAETGHDGILILIEDITETAILEAGLTHSERLASIGRLAAGVAHEIGNPITGIACLAQNIRDETQDNDLRTMATQIIEQTERTSRIVQSLVNFAHAGSPRSGLSMENISIRDCMDEAVTLVSLDKKGKSMGYVVDSDPRLTIKGDSQRLLQVFLNLINNSRDASQPDGTIYLICRTADDNVEIIVEDEGVGIPQAVQHRVFDPFFTTKEAGKGTGLGLSLVYSIVEDLQGTIDIMSPCRFKPNRGTRVTLTFPRLETAACDDRNTGAATERAPS